MAYNIIHQLYGVQLRSQNSWFFIKAPHFAGNINFFQCVKARKTTYKVLKLNRLHWICEVQIKSKLRVSALGVRRSVADGLLYANTLTNRPRARSFDFSLS